jgi:hypothetical protein
MNAVFNIGLKKNNKPTGWFILKNYYLCIIIKAPLRFVPEDAKVYQKEQQLEQWNAVGEKLRNAAGK